MHQPADERTEIHVGVLLAESSPGAIDSLSSPDLDEDGNVPAAGYRGRHKIDPAARVVQLGHDVLRAAAVAVGSEVALVIDGVVAGIEGQTAQKSQSFTIEDLELKFGVKATLGAGKAVEALLAASGEATVEVTLKLRQL